MRSRPILVVCLLLAACSTAAEVESETAAQAPTTEPATTSQALTTEPPTTPPMAVGTTTGVEESEEPVYLDFSAIEGLWTGEAYEVAGYDFWVRATIGQSEARLESRVGTVRYGLVGSETTDCTGVWVAKGADPPVYNFRERITTGICADGDVRLELDSQTGTLIYEFRGADPLLNADGTLTKSE